MYIEGTGNLLILAGKQMYINLPLGCLTGSLLLGGKESITLPLSPEKSLERSGMIILSSISCLTVKRFHMKSKVKFILIFKVT